jgi:hypothetical protein
MQIIPEIREGQSIELLKELHILTRDGKLNQDTRRKLKQVYHLYQFIEPLLNESGTLVDHGAGKSYLGFILYDLFYKSRQGGHVYGIESRTELVEKSRALAQRLSYERMKFLPLTVAQAMHSGDVPSKVDVVTALHACDTATDDAISFGLARHANHMVLVPCCQAEIAGLLKKSKGPSLAKTALTEIWRHPLHTREFGSHVTNVLRCLWLEAHGYQVRVTELVGWEHSMKNELILATFKDLPRRHPRERLRVLLEELGLEGLAERYLA